MSLEFGIVAILLISLFPTYFLFGRNADNSFRSTFCYWLKSAILVGGCLFSWFCYKEAEGASWLGALMSLGLAYLICVAPRSGLDYKM